MLELANAEREPEAQSTLLMSTHPSPKSPANREVAQYVSKVFGGKPEVHMYNHDHSGLSMAILFAPERPHAELISFATIGLSDYPLLEKGRELKARAELAGLCLVEHAPLFANILASAAFAIIRGSLRLRPGFCLQDAVRDYYSNATVPHLYFMDPYLWAEDLTIHTFSEKTVGWLLAVPISEPEYRYLAAHGPDEFEELLDRKGVDIYDLMREPAI